MDLKRYLVICISIYKYIEIQIQKTHTNTCRGADYVAEHEVAREAEEKDDTVEKRSCLPGFTKIYILTKIERD